jgi:HrpA-like RNA helicase
MLHIDSIFLDEVHERSFCCDIITGTLKDLHKKSLLQTDLKVILCSATINKTLFCEFFNNCKVIEIAGTTHPIADYYRPSQD